jgi:hypothetical protein
MNGVSKNGDANMRRTKASFITLVSLLFAAVPVQAASPITISEYVELKREKNVDILVPYMSGAADALWSTNFVLLATGKRPLYCGQNDSPISATQLINLTDNFLASAIRSGRTPPNAMTLTTVSANAVATAFPCN